ncbi:MAG: Ig-like domain repeat protein [Chloroflexi bacterium]|nr:Ig-like domain repeat protein [Chloroflexota bacterium]
MATTKRSGQTRRGPLARIRSRIMRGSVMLLVAAVAAFGTYGIVRAAPTIVATMTDAFIGGDGDGKADPGEVIEYTVSIPNTGSDATGVTFNDIIDANTTLVGGSVNVSPLAINDSYDTIGNTLLEVGVAAGSAPAVHISSNLFANDVEFLGDAGTFTLTAHTNPSNGTLSVFDSASGTFSYLPNPGFTGTDTFTYTLTDSGGLSDTATVTINVTTQRIWYVKNDATAGGQGRSTDPFDTLVEAQTASAANDTIYVFAGNGTTSGQNAGITLKAGQRLLGEGVALTIPVSVNGGANPTTLRAAGTAPLIDNTAGNGVSVTDISNVEIRGLNIAGTPNAVNVTTTAANSGSFELANNTIRSATANGIDVNGGGSGTLTVSIHGNAVTASGNGIDIQRTAGSVVVTAFDDNTISGNTVGIGINVVGTGATILFDTNPATGTFDTVPGGTTAIGQSGNGVGTSGLVLSNVRGDLNFADLDIYADNGTALFIDGTSSNYTGTTGTRVVANTNSTTLSATNGPAADFKETAVNFSGVALTSSTSATTGVSMVEVSGTFPISTGSSITNATGTDFFVNNNSVATAVPAVTYDGTISDDQGSLIQIQNAPGGSYTFTGSITDLDNGTGNGVSLTNNTGATITFAGGLVLSTGANAAFTATGGGTVNVCDESPCAPGSTGALVNKLTTTTATALNVNGTTIGANNLEFKSISSNGGSATGIILVNTGASGSLVVKGDGGTARGGNSSGGTIANKTGGADGDGTTSSGVYINNGSAILRNMTMFRLDNYGVYGLGVRNVTVQYSSIGAISGAACADGDGDIGSTSASGDAALVFGVSNPSGSNGFTSSGTLLLDNLKVYCSIEHQVEIYQQSGTFTATISNSDIKDASSLLGGDGVQTEMQGTATATITVDTVSFDDNKSQAVQAAANDSSTLDMTVKNSTLVRSTQGNEGILLSNGSNGHLTAHVTGNNISGIPGANIYVGQTAGNATSSSYLTAYIANNTITHPTSATNSAILAFLTSCNGSSCTAQSAPANIMITNNTVFENSTGGVSRGILVDTPDASSLPNFSASVISNTVHIYDNVLGLQGIAVQGRQSSTACYDVRSNLVDFPNGVPAGINGIRIRQANTATVNLAQGVSGSTAAATVLANNNTATTEALGTVNVVSNGTCLAPPVAAQPSSQTLANTQPSDDAVAVAPAALNTLTTTMSASVERSKQTEPSAVASGPTIQASTGVGGGKPLFIIEPAPAQSGETVNVTIGTLPAGETVTIKYRVTVNGPSLPLGTTKITNQGTVSGSNFSDVLTTNGGPVDCETGSETCTPVDRPDTTVTSINRTSANPTGAASVSWQVIFADPISGLTASNFSLVAGGSVSGASITSVTPSSGSPSATWTVTANSGTGDGTLGLNLVNDTVLSHDVTNLPFTGQVYTLDHTPPTVTINKATGQADPTGISPINFTVVFSEPVTGFATGDVSLGGTANPTTGTVTEITPNDGTTYNVAVSGMTTDGTVTATIGTGVAKDAAGNDNAASTSTDNSVLYDTAVPTVTINKATGQADPTNIGPIHFTVVFSEPVTGFATGDMTLSGTANPTTGTVTEIAPNDGTTFDVAVSGMNSNGTVIATIGAGVALDVANNGNTASTSTDNSVLFDDIQPVAPVVTTPANGSYTNSPSPVVTGTAEPNSTVTVYIDGSSVGTTSADASGTWSFSSVPALSAGLHNVKATATDAANNTSSFSNTNTFTVDLTAPGVTINKATGQADPTGVSPIHFTVVFSEPITGFATGDVTLGGTTGATTATVTEIAPNNGTTFDVAVSGMTSDGTVTATLGAGVAKDLAGNDNTASTSTDNSVVYDTVVPSVTINQASGQADPTGVSPIHFTVVFSEPVTGFATGDVTLGGSANPTTGTVTEIAPNNGTTFDVAVSGMNTNGTVTASLGAGVAKDAGNNDNTASTSTDNTVTYDATAPSVTINQASGQTDPTSTSPVNFKVVFSEPVTGFATGDVTLGGTANPTTGTVTEIAPNDGTTYNVAVSGMTTGGTVTASIDPNKAQDSSGNGNTASTSTDNMVKFTFNTTTAITSDTPDPSIIGESVAFNYTVSVNGGSGTPTGNVTVSDGANSCTGTVAAGTCSITFTSLGTKTLTATYEGDTYFNTSTSASVSHQVVNANTTTTITSDTPDPSLTGDAVTVNYSVTVVAPGTGIPTGNVTVSDGTNSCTGTVATGTCSITLTTPGVRTLTATYAGDSNFGGSTSAGVSHTVNAAPAITSANTITFMVGINGSFTVTATGYPTPSLSSSGALPSGVTFVDNGDGTATLSGAPAFGSSGTYPLTFTASSGFGTDATQNFTLIVSIDPIFVDVPNDYWAAPYINAIYYAGITSGCSSSPMSFCPTAFVTRAEMAVFLKRGLHGGAYQPPLPASFHFTDTVGHWAQNWIEDLYNEGITGGCGPTTFCPDVQVDRAQMAVFLLRLKYGANYTPPSATGTVFTDVQSSYWAAAWIEQLYNEGITSGCGAGMYCPNAPVTRAEMAVLLVRTLNLTLP